MSQLVSIIGVSCDFGAQIATNVQRILQEKHKLTIEIVRVESEQFNTFKAGAFIDVHFGEYSDKPYSTKYTCPCKDVYVFHIWPHNLGTRGLQAAHEIAAVIARGVCTWHDRSSDGVTIIRTCQNGWGMEPKPRTDKFPPESTGWLAQPTTLSLGLCK